MKDFNKKVKKNSRTEEMDIFFDIGFTHKKNVKNENNEKNEKNEKSHIENIPKKRKVAKRKKQEYFFDTENKKKYKQELELLIDEKNKKEHFQLDINDPRFNAIFKETKYAIDPTSHLYKEKESQNLFKAQIQSRKSKNQNEIS